MLLKFTGRGLSFFHLLCGSSFRTVVLRGFACMHGREFFACCFAGLGIFAIGCEGKRCRPRGLFLRLQGRGSLALLIYEAGRCRLIFCETKELLLFGKQMIFGLRRRGFGLFDFNAYTATPKTLFLNCPMYHWG